MSTRQGRGSSVCQGGNATVFRVNRGILQFIKELLKIITHALVESTLVEDPASVDQNCPRGQ